MQQPQIHPMMAPAPRPEEKEYHHRRHGSLGLDQTVPVLQDLGVPSPSPFQSSLKAPPRRNVSPSPIMEHAAQPFMHRIGSMDSASVSSQSSAMSSWVCTKCSYSNVDVYNERCAVCGISDPQQQPASKKAATSWLSIGSRFSSGAPVEVSDDEEESEPNLLPEQTATIGTAKSPNTPKRPSPEHSLSEISSPPQRPTLPIGSSQSTDQVMLFPGSPNLQDDDVHSVTNHSIATVKVSNQNGMPQRRPQDQFAAPTFNIHRTMLDDDPKTPPISNTTNKTSLVRHPTMPNLGASTHSNMPTSTHIISSRSSSSSASTLVQSFRLELTSSSNTRRNSGDHQLPSRKIPVPPLNQKMASDVHIKPKARSSGVREDWEQPTGTASSKAFAARRQMRSSSVTSLSSTPNTSPRPLDAPLQNKCSYRTLATTCSSHADEPTQAKNEVELMELGGQPTTARSQRSTSPVSFHSSGDSDHVTMDTDNDPPKRRTRKLWLLLFLFAIVALIVALIVGVVTSKNSRNANATSGLEATKDLDLAPTITPAVVDRETPTVVDLTLAPEMVSTPTPAPILFKPTPGGDPVVLPPSVTDRVELVVLTESPLVGQSLHNLGTKVVVGGPTGDWIAVTGAGIVGLVEFAWDLSTNVAQEQDRKGMFLPVGNDPINGAFVEPSNEVSVALSEGVGMAIASNGELFVSQLNVTSNEWYAIGQHVVLGQKDRIGINNQAPVPTSVAMSGDGSIVASGIILLQADLKFTTVLQVWQYLPSVKLWEQMFYKPERLLLGTTATIMDVELSSSGKTMVVAIHGSYQVQAYHFGNETFSRAGDQKIFQNLVKFHGIALSGDGRTLVVVRSFDTVIFFYDGTDEQWTLHSILLQRGTSVSVNYAGDIVAIGDDAAVDASGRKVGKVAVFLYDPSTDAYDLVDQVPGNENSRFGESVSVSGKRLAVGAPCDSENGLKSGSVYLYNIPVY